MHMIASKNWDRNPLMKTGNVCLIHPKASFIRFLNLGNILGCDRVLGNDAMCSIRYISKDDKNLPEAYRLSENNGELYFSGNLCSTFRDRNTGEYVTSGLFNFSNHTYLVEKIVIDGKIVRNVFYYNGLTHEVSYLGDESDFSKDDYVQIARNIKLWNKFKKEYVLTYLRQRETERTQRLIALIHKQINPKISA